MAPIGDFLGMVEARTNAESRLATRPWSAPLLANQVVAMAMLTVAAAVAIGVPRSILRR
ncbi:MAG: hypothetical protein U0800_14295 [Isosphaeraceae bacterium]